eukprot:CAMPEP_0194778830 /NCGR_PEP_ID=MMETSP0323_2-20130528/69287_1 /TAXON_ID=2866 ORGANISM="Crypthecodinium cohnii, Strain Seligo" /NCGR_SAMPLE_ID=MMETSP0323_2 /ASSEMBLY_ACC=CAM_ASM_000346 /LENGTH=34 /DNA_ID= /DNA_START= /DNA_END= /DNA_ORIENTATION=
MRDSLLNHQLLKVEEPRHVRGVLADAVAGPSAFQ